MYWEWKSKKWKKLHTVEIHVSITKITTPQLPTSSYNAEWPSVCYCMAGGSLHSNSMYVLPSAHPPPTNTTNFANNACHCSLGVPTNIFTGISACLCSALKWRWRQLIVHKSWYPQVACMVLKHRNPLSEPPILHRRLCTMELGCFE
jgi:hypothetical protein